MQRKYNATTLLDDGDLAPFFGSIKSRILEEINDKTPTNFHFNHFNHEGVVECPRKKTKVHMQRKYNAATLLDVGNLAPFFGSMESRMTPFQEEEDDMHMSSLTYTIESRTTPFQEEEDDVHMPRHTYIIESRTTPFQEGEDDVGIPRVTQDHASNTQALVLQGSITCSHAKKLQQKVNSFLAEINSKIYENVILSKGCTLVDLRNIHEEDGTTKHGEEVNNRKTSDQE
jgi:hypothetical protein